MTLLTKRDTIKSQKQRRKPKHRVPENTRRRCGASDVVNAPTKLEPTFTVTRIARDFGLTAQGLNRILASLGIQHKSNGNWIITDELADKGYTVTRQYNEYKAMCWTERGI